MIPREEKTVFSVSQLNRKAKQLLETHLPLIWVTGEISGLSRPGSGHWYLTLKDQNAQIRCAMFRGANSRIRWQVENGQQVLVRARVSIYEGRGDYQLIVEHMEQAGAGLLQQQYEQLKQKLQSEGLFDEQHKKPLPAVSQHIGVITSASGAALADILTVFARRQPSLHITVIPVSVQGAEAAPSMIEALDLAVQFGEFDLLIIGRGGGSIEDLWAFNNEALVRKLFACPIPTISAVGHEVDFTLCDFVADVRAPTPSASAEIASIDGEQWQQSLDQLSLDLEKSVLRILKTYGQHLNTLRKQLRHPKQELRLKKQQLSSLEQRMTMAQKSLSQNTQNRLAHLKIKLQQNSPTGGIKYQRHNLTQLNKRLKRAITQTTSEKQLKLQHSSHMLDAVSPLKILDRGYAVVKTETGIVKNSEEISVGQRVTTRISEGEFTSQILEITPPKNQ